jgi:Arc/MetJ-type ribon-helix-helix transcriptional regulator
MLTGIFVSEKEVIRRGRRKLHNKEFHNLYSLPDIVMAIQSKQSDWTCTTHGEDKEFF